MQGPRRHGTWEERSAMPSHVSPTYIAGEGTLKEAATLPYHAQSRSTQTLGHLVAMPLHGMAWHVDLSAAYALQCERSGFPPSSPRRGQQREVVAEVRFVVCSSLTRIKMALETMPAPSSLCRHPYSSLSSPSDLRYCFAPSAVDDKLYITNLLTEPRPEQLVDAHSYG